MFFPPWRIFAALIGLDKGSDSWFFHLVPPTVVLANVASRLSPLRDDTEEQNSDKNAQCLLTDFVS
jgi:hypothetical protein